MIDKAEMARAVDLLERAGVQHAPEQRYTEWPHEIYGREVTFLTPPGVYYLRADDCGEDRMRIQVLWVDTPEDGPGRISAGNLARMVGWVLTNPPAPMESSEPIKRTFVAAIMEKLVVH